MSNTANQPENTTPGRDIEAAAEASKAHSFALSSVNLRPLTRKDHSTELEGQLPDRSIGVEDTEQRNCDAAGHREDQPEGLNNEPDLFVQPPRSSGRGSRRIFGTLGPLPKTLGGEQTKNATGGGDGGFIGAFDYDKKYPYDKYREEMEPEARVWKIYLDEAAEDDRFRIENLRDTLDVILVFAGLFSAVVTTFVVHTVESLEGESTWETTQISLLTEMVCIQRSVAAGIPLDSCESSSSPVQLNPASTHDYAVNAFFFVSLTLALCTALAAVLAKQWLHHYLQPVPGNPQDRSRKRQFRHDGFVQYRVGVIIGLLPILIHLSLFLFFIGLGIFLLPLHTISAVFVAVTTGSTLVLYMISNVLPIFDSQCPYHTPLTTGVFETSCFIYTALLLPLRYCA